MTAKTEAFELSDQLAAELAAMPTPATYGAAVAAVSALRAKYTGRLHALARTGDFSDTLVHGLGAALQLQCDRKIALHATIVDANHGPSPGFTSVPINCLTQDEKEQLL